MRILHRTVMGSTRAAIIFSVLRVGLFTPVQVQVDYPAGNIVRESLNDHLSSGRSTALWVGTDKSGEPETACIYVVRLMLIPTSDSGEDTSFSRLVQVVY